MAWATARHETITRRAVEENNVKEKGMLKVTDLFDMIKRGFLQ
jgi:hypothetical protein